MSAVLRYGVDQSVELSPAADGVLIECGQPQGEPQPDIKAAVTAALGEPLNYPPLARGITPGDRIAIALEAGVPQAGPIVAATIGYLARNGVNLDGITVLCTGVDGPAPIEEINAAWPAAWKDQIKIAVHDPADARQLVYLARDSLGEPLFLNRALTDADVVLPIGLLCDSRASGYFGLHTGVFPTFSSPQSMGLFHVLAALRERGKHRRRLLAEVEQVGWLLGVTFTIQVLPGGGDRVLQVLAGEPGAVGVRGRELYHSVWNGRVSQRASLVAAAMEGGPEQQTWVNFARALAAAIPLAEEGGALALCCDLRAEPGPALQSLRDAISPQDTLLQISKRRFADLLPAAALARALESYRVYLLSGLDPLLVEQLGMVPLAGTEDLMRVVHRQSSCILLANAPHAAVQTQQDV